MSIQAIHPGLETSKPHPRSKKYTHTATARPEINRANQAWVSNVTCLPMASGFLYLTAIMDWFGRKVLNWRVSRVWIPVFVSMRSKKRFVDIWGTGYIQPGQAVNTPVIQTLKATPDQAYDKSIRLPEAG